MLTCDLYTILKEELKNGSNNLVTRPTGQAVRERIERDMEQAPEGSVIGLDFSKVGVIDYSCSDEIVAKLLSRLLAGEYGEKYLMLTGMNDNQRENIEVALERKDLAIIAETSEGTKGGAREPQQVSPGHAGVRRRTEEGHGAGAFRSGQDRGEHERYPAPEPVQEAAGRGGSGGEGAMWAYEAL